MISSFSPKIFDDAVAKKLGSKVKPEPWLHVAVLGLGNHFTYEKTKKPEDSERVVYAVYVWDTRKVIESGTIEFGGDFHACQQLQFYFAQPKKGRNAKFSQIYHAKNAKDNRKKISGSGEEVSLINEYIFNDK